MTHLIGVPGHWYPSHCAASEPDLARADMWKMLHVWWKGSIYNISPLRSADSIHIIYIDLELIYLYFEKYIWDAMGWVVNPLRSATFLDDQTTSQVNAKETPWWPISQDKNLEQDMKQYCTQHNCQQFEDPHSSLQQGLAWVQQGLEEYVFVNGGMQISVD